MEWCWNGAATEDRGAATMEQRLVNSHEMKGRQLGNPVKQVEMKRYRESTAGCRDYLEAKQAIASELVLSGWTKYTYIKYCNKLISEDHESTVANVKSRVIEELNECVASASVDVEDSLRGEHAFEC